MSSCSSIIRHIVQIRQMLRRWRKKASMAARRAPCNVPAGHIAVTVGLSFKRYVVRATYLNHPLFRKLLVQAEEEFGFTNTGPLAIPCDEIIFEEIMRYLARTESGVKNPARFATFEEDSLHVGCRSHLDFRADSRPLLHSVYASNIW